MKFLIKFTMIYICIFMIIGCGKSNDKNEDGIFRKADGSEGGHDLQVVYVDPNSQIMYIELKSIARDGDIVSVWNVIDFQGSTLNNIKEKYNVSSSKILEQYNCNEKTSRQQRVRGYTGVMNSGKLISEEQASGPDSEWTKVDIGSTGEKKLNIVCKLTQSNASAPTPVVTASVPAAPTQASATPAATTPELVVDNTPFAPSFDCAKASNSMEKMICGDRQLSALDVKLSQAYSKALSTAQDKQKLKSEQITWIKQARTCADVTCVQQSLQQRISQLSASN